MIREKCIRDTRVYKKRAVFTKSVFLDNFMAFNNQLDKLIFLIYF